MKATDKVTITIEAGTLLSIYNVMVGEYGEYDDWERLRDAMLPVMAANAQGHYSDFKFDNDVKTIPLNSEYSAEILNGKVKVGCQEFTFDAIKKLNKAIKKATP
jgi:hypothetical protein